MNQRASFLSSEKPSVQLFRFGLCCAGTFAAKIMLTSLLTRVFQEHASYLAVHVIIFFWAYYCHLFFTFHERHSRTHLWRFFKAVIGIKLVDFLIFCLVLDISNQVSLSVIVASITLFLVRFRVVRRALFQYDGRSRTTVP